MTSLDFIGVYDPVTRLKTMGFIPDLQWDVCAYSKEGMAPGFNTLRQEWVDLSKTTT